MYVPMPLMIGIAAIVFLLLLALIIDVLDDYNL